VVGFGPDPISEIAGTGAIGTDGAMTEDDAISATIGGGPCDGGVRSH
jgi:hypothetical protein